MNDRSGRPPSSGPDTAGRGAGAADPVLVRAGSYASPLRRSPLDARTRRNLWIAGGGVLLLALGVWLVVAQLPRFLADGEPTGPAAAETPVAPVRRIQATLYYPSDDGSELVPVLREVVYGDSPAEQIRHIVEAQVAAPGEGLTSAIPAGTTVRSVFLTSRAEAYIDLAGTIVSGHSGGSLDEALAVYAIVNAVTVNLPDVTAVQILIQGREVDTLAGHLDLRHPLRKALDWVRKGP